MSIEDKEAHEMKVALSMKEVAQALGIAEHTVRRLVRTGELPAIRISERRIIIPAEALNNWLSAKADADRS